MAVTNDPSPPGDDRDAGAIADLLSHPRRQSLLEALSETDADRVALSDLVAAVHRRELDDDPNHRAHLENVLHHTDLPQLETLDVLEYDPESRRVHPRHDRIDELLTAVERAYRLLGDE